MSDITRKIGWQVSLSGITYLRIGTESLYNAGELSRQSLLEIIDSDICGDILMEMDYEIDEDLDELVDGIIEQIKDRASKKYLSENQGNLF